METIDVTVTPPLLAPAATPAPGASTPLEGLGWDAGWADAFAPHAAQGLHPARVVAAHRDRWVVALPSGGSEAVVSGRLRHAALGPGALPGADLGTPMASLIIRVEAATVQRRGRSERPGDYAPETLARLETGTHYAAADYRLALCARAELLGRIGDTVFDRVDLLVTPTATVTAPRIDGADLPAGSGFADLVGPVGRCLRLFNVTGLPALALPAGLSANGLPASIQLVGRPYDEATILRVGAAYEEAVGGFAAPPPRPITPDRQRGST